jgi:hypothetical protein
MALFGERGFFFGCAVRDGRLRLLEYNGRGRGLRCWLACLNSGGPFAGGGGGSEASLGDFYCLQHRLGLVHRFFVFGFGD